VGVGCIAVEAVGAGSARAGRAAVVAVAAEGRARIVVAFEAGAAHRVGDPGAEVCGGAGGAAGCCEIAGGAAVVAGEGETVGGRRGVFDVSVVALAAAASREETGARTGLAAGAGASRTSQAADVAIQTDPVGVVLAGVALCEDFGDEQGAKEKGQCSHLTIIFISSGKEHRNRLYFIGRTKKTHTLILQK
jgi:hypothetical protein